MVKPPFIIAAKCAPERAILSAIKRSRLTAVELYLSDKMLSDVTGIIRICRGFPFRYALHAPTSGYNPHAVQKIARAIKAEIVVFHDVYWDDEWAEIARVFKHCAAKVCVENIATVHEPTKLIRRYGFGRCLDLEHLQMECNGVFEEEFIRVIQGSSHIHMTGYKHGTQLWHTPLYASPAHCQNLLNLLKKANYKGLVVSEAKQSFQIFPSFVKLRKYFDSWLSCQV